MTNQFELKVKCSLNSLTFVDVPNLLFYFKKERENTFVSDRTVEWVTKQGLVRRTLELSRRRSNPAIRVSLVSFPIDKQLVADSCRNSQSK